MSERRTGPSLVAALAVGALVAGGVAISAPAGAAKRDVQPRSATYQYGNWAQPGSGFTTGSDDTLSQVYQLTWRGSFPDLDDTPGPIYAAGTFIRSGSTTINRVGQWDDTTSSWVTLPGDDTGIGFGVGQALARTAGQSAGFALPGVFGLVLGGDDSLYAGGAFTASDDTLNNVAQWNGSDWVRMGNGLTAGSSGTGFVNEIVQDMVIGNDFIGMDDTNYADDTVYAIGGFDGICSNLACGSVGTAAAGIAQYSQVDDTWYRMGNGTISQTAGVNDLVFAGAYIDDTLYVGGDFSSIGSVNASVVAQWRESDDTWLPLGGGLTDGDVFAMAVHPITKDLYVGGTFDQPTGYPTDSMLGIAKWDYTDDTWYAVGTGLTNGNTDDISFSADGKTMWIGSWGSAPTIGGIGGIAANGIATLTSEDFDDTAATTISGTWGYLKSTGVIGVTGPTNDTINQSSTRAVLAQPNGTMLAAGNFHTAGAVSARRVALFTPGREPSPYDPVYPPGVPTDVVATGGWNKVTVEWKAPTYTGSYPITNYLVTSTPGNRNCITSLRDAKLTECTFTSLTPGTQYTFRVQGLNGGGWGDRSASSNVTASQNLKITSYSRTKIRFLFVDRGSEAKASGIAPGFAVGTKIVPWVKIGDREWAASENSRLAVNSSGRFEWKRKFSRNQNGQAISVKFAIGENFSNTVIIPRVR